MTKPLTALIKRLLQFNLLEMPALSLGDRSHAGIMGRQTDYI